MSTLVYQQLAESFARPPGLDGTIHGTRRIIQGKHGSRSSLFFSAKNDALMPVESRLERSVCYRLEWDRGVTKYRMQPVAVPYGSEKLHPDICIRNLRGDFRILEVKPDVFALTSDNLRKADFLRAYFSELDISYEVAGEAYCGSEIEQENLSMLYNRGGRLALEDELLKGLAERVLYNDGPISKSEAATRLSRVGIAHYYLEAALFKGYLKCDMRRPISQATLVERSQ